MSVVPVDCVSGTNGTTLTYVPFESGEKYRNPTPSRCRPLCPPLGALDGNAKRQHPASANESSAFADTNAPPGAVNVTALAPCASANPHSTLTPPTSVTVEFSVSDSV